MANRKRGTKQSRTKWIKKDSEDFLKNPTGKPIYSRTGERLEIKPDERFVRVYEDGEPSKENFVSNYGHIVQYSQKTRAERIWNPGYLENTKDPEKSYLKFGYNVYIHRAEWFSFAYDAITHGKIDEIPKIWDREYFTSGKFGSPEQTLKYLFRSKHTQGKKTKASFEVHHRKNDPQDNRLSNLQLVINTQEEPVHDRTTNAMKDFTNSVGKKLSENYRATATNGIAEFIDSKTGKTIGKLYLKDATIIEPLGDTINVGYVIYKNFKIIPLDTAAQAHLLDGNLTEQELTQLEESIIQACLKVECASVNLGEYGKYMIEINK